MFSPLSRLRRQLSQRESQVPRVTHYTERCIEVRPRYLFDKFRFAGEFGSIVSYGRINYKNSHSSLHCYGCSLPYEHRPFCGVFFFQSSGSPAMTVCRMRRIPHPHRLRKGADPAAMYRKTEPRRLLLEAAGVVFAFQPFWISSSAICTQLVAAPLRTWSPQHQRHRPLGSVRSGRMRPTNTRS